MKKKRKKVNQQGFSVVELIVVISIFVIMLSVSMFDYRSARRNIEATNLAEDIALTLRQAQVYGLSASEKVLGKEDLNEIDYFKAKDITEDRSVRGVAVILGEKRVYLFQDMNGDFNFSKDDDLILDERNVYSPDVSIDRITICKEGTCAEKRGNGDILSITFQRPYPDAYIVYNSGSSHSLYNSVEIQITDARSGELLRKVFINSVGSIAVK